MFPATSAFLRMMHRLILLLSLLIAAPLAAQTIPAATDAIVPPAPSLSLHLVLSDDGTLAFEAPDAPIPDGQPDATVLLAPAQDRWDGAWAGAKKGMIVGAIVGGALIAAGVIIDLNYCDACHVPTTLFAVVWAGAAFVGATAGGAIIGYALDDD